MAAGPDGLTSLINRGGDKNGWLAVRLRGLVQGNSKNNLRGVGSSVEVKVGTAYQFREHDGRASHFGLGRQAAADAVRVVWTNGVPQDRVDVSGNQAIVEEQVLKGSCPFLYTYTGTDGGPGPDGGIGFVTDLLWNAPAGLPVAPGVYLPADPDELVEVRGARSLPGRPGVYDLRITEELWEAAYFDHVRLWVVDHPADVEVASSLRIVPGPVAAAERPGGDEVLAARAVRPVVAATDGRGRDVTDRVRARDDVYADGYSRGPYQGLAAAPWDFTVDLGPEAAARPGGGPVRLLLDGWIFPADASLNLAIAQRDDLAPEAPRLEVETADGWRVLMPHMGHPAGKTKTMVVDTPPLPAGARRLRIVTNQWISWDRIAWSRSPADDAVRVAGRLLPASARRCATAASPRWCARRRTRPTAFDYARTSTTSPWEPTAGPYTRYGDVRELLAASDDRPVVMGSGDEIDLLFDASGAAGAAGGVGADAVPGEPRLGQGFRPQHVRGRARQSAVAVPGDGDLRAVDGRGGGAGSAGGLRGAVVDARVARAGGGAGGGEVVLRLRVCRERPAGRVSEGTAGELGGWETNSRLVGVRVGPSRILDCRRGRGRRRPSTTLPAGRSPCAPLVPPPRSRGVEEKTGGRWRPSPPLTPPASTP